MKSRISWLLLLAFLSIFFSMNSPHANEVAEKAAILTSETWLSLVDKGRYGESWDQAAFLFKTLVAKEQWQKSMKDFRAPMGKVVVRKLISKQYTKTLPGAPDGDYVMIQYETEFEKKKSAVETITPMLDKDGKWRVAGYYIK